MTKPRKQAEELALIYDGECPVCTAYSCTVDVDEGKASGIRRINARSDDALVKQAKDAGIDLDEGMTSTAYDNRIISFLRLYVLPQLWRLLRKRSCPLSPDGAGGQCIVRIRHDFNRAICGSNCGSWATQAG